MLTYKIPYVCGPLTELPAGVQERAKNFYVRIADLCEKETGERAFVPHERFDPVKHASFSPKEVDVAERKQICARTSLLIVVAIAPSWGGGIEVEMAYDNGVPVVILCKKNKRLSRLLLGNPAVIGVIYYASEKDALSQLRQTIAGYPETAPSFNGQ